jgi:hypothetical protein
METGRAGAPESMADDRHTKTTASEAGEGRASPSAFALRSSIDRSIYAQIYVDRSRELQLDVIIDSPSADKHLPGYTVFRDEVHAVFDIILPSVGRWRSFTLKVRDSVVKERARMRLANVPAPQLESLKLYHLENWPDAEAMFQAMQRPPVSFDGDMLHCRHLSLVGMSIPWKDPPYWQNLQSLDLRLHGETFRPEYAQWERLLLDSPGLQRLALHYSGPKKLDVDSYPFQLIPLHSLRELVLVDLDGDHLCYILRHMRMPNLRVLRLDLPDQDVTPFVQLASDPAAPLFSSLELLGITSLQCTGLAWRHFLQSLTNLLTLELDLRRMHGRLMDEIMTGACKSEILARPTIPDEPLPSMLMPVLEVVKVKGITGTALDRLSLYRRQGGCEVKKWMLDAKSKDETVEDLRMRRGVNIEYFEASDDEQDEEEEEEEDSCDEEDADEDAEEDETGSMED